MSRIAMLRALVVGAIVVVAALGLAPPGVAATQVRDLDTAARGTPFSFLMPSFGFSTNQFSKTVSFTPTIPAGKKLYIQRVSVHVLFTDGQSPMEVTLTLPGGGLLSVDMDFQAATSGSNGQRHFVGNQDVDVILTQGQSIPVLIFRNDDLGNSSLNFAKVSFFGYFVDINP